MDYADCGDGLAKCVCSEGSLIGGAVPPFAIQQTIRRLHASSNGTIEIF